MRTPHAPLLAYVFGSEERWQGWWDTPNQAAAVLATLLPLLLGLMLWAASHARLWRWARWSAVGGGSAALVALLWHSARSYSRGGWVAMGLGFAMLALAHRRARIPVLVTAAAFALMLVCLPAGLARAGTAADWQEDKSVAHRFLIWRGALEMLAEHPLSGVGAGRFGEEFMAWYQPLEMETRHLTAVNDHLTVAAERGLVVLASFLAMVCGPVWAVWWLGRRVQSLVYVSVAAAVCAFFTSGIFSSLVFKLAVAWPGWCLWGCLWVCLFRPARQGGCILRLRATLLAPGLLGGCVFALGCWLAGLWFCSSLPLRISPFSVPGTAGGFVIEPRTSRAKSTVLYFPDCSETPLEWGRCLARPLAKRGLRVLVFTQPASSMEALRLARDQLRAARSLSPGTPLVLAGHRQGGVTALAMAAESSPGEIFSVAVWAAPALGAFPNFSAELLARKVRCAVWLAHGEADAELPALHAERLHRVPHPPGANRHLILARATGALPEPSALRAWMNVIEQAGAGP